MTAVKPAVVGQFCVTAELLFPIPAITRDDGDDGDPGDPSGPLLMFLSH